jgi:hypothetical protein
VRSRLLIALTVLAVLVAGIAVAQPRASHARPRLSLLQRSPLKVRGAGFHRTERVRVVARVNGGAPVTRRVNARRTGRFVVSFADQASPGCGVLLVKATGSRGSRASLALRSPECMVR